MIHSPDARVTRARGAVPIAVPGMTGLSRTSQGGGSHHVRGHSGAPSRSVRDRCPTVICSHACANPINR
jgi:hypothetical protein